MELTKTLVRLRHDRNKQKTSEHREGFVDENRLVYMPPRDVRKVNGWKLKMRALGLEVP